MVLVDELDSELAWAQGRKGSMAHGYKKLTMESAEQTDEDWKWQDVLDHVPMAATSCVGPFFKALSPQEMSNLLGYKRAWPEQAWQLNQSASEHGQHSNSHYLHTLIRNCGMIFSDQVYPPRWLSPSELFLVTARDWFYCFSLSFCSQFAYAVGLFLARFSINLDTWCSSLRNFFSVFSLVCIVAPLTRGYVCKDFHCCLVAGQNRSKFVLSSHGWKNNGIQGRWESRPETA